jgi:hypothetical protein
MPTFSQTFIPITSDDTNDLVITDTSVYDNVNFPKTLFTNRTIQVTKSDSTSTTYNFPYTNSNNSLQDQYAIGGFFDKDYAITILVTWYTSSGNYTQVVTYLGFKKAFNNKKKLFISLVCGECDCGCNEDEIENELNFYKADSLIEASKNIYKSNLIEAQKNLDWLGNFFIQIFSN